MKQEQSWISKRTTLEKHLIIALFLTVILSVLILGGVKCRFSKSCSKEESTTSSYILEKLHKDVKPCQSFYGFACRIRINETLLNVNNIPYINAIHIPDDRSAIKTLKGYLEEDPQKGEFNFSRSAKTFYKSCIKAGKKDNMEMFNKHIKEFGGWPLLEGNDWNETNFDWVELMRVLREKGYTTEMFVKLNIVSYIKDSEPHYIIQLKRPTLFGTDWAFLVKPQKHQERYYKLLDRVIAEFHRDGSTYSKYVDERRSEIASYQKEFAQDYKWLGNGLPSLSSLNRVNNVPDYLHDTKKTQKEDLLKDKKSIINLENELARVKVNASFKNITGTEKEFRINWFEFVKNVVPPNVNLNSDNTIISAQTSYILEFEKIMETKEKRLLANYAIWRAMLEKIHYFPRSVQEVFSELFHSDVKKHSSVECVMNTYQSLPHILNSIYLSQLNIEEIEKMVHYLKSYILSQLQWMSNEAKEQLKKLKISVAEPNDEILEKYYGQLILEPNEYLVNSLKIQKHSVEAYSVEDLEIWKKEEAIIKKPVFYSSGKNVIYLSPALLQNPFYYNNQKNMSLNFGSLGSIISHVLVNQFTELNITSQKIDEDLAVETLVANRTMQLQTVASRNVIGNGDAEARTGILLTYSAFSDWLEYNIDSGLSTYSPQKLFWISAATSWCALYKQDYLERIVTTHKYLINSFDVTIPFENSLEFRTSFKC